MAHSRRAPDFGHSPQATPQSGKGQNTRKTPMEKYYPQQNRRPKPWTAPLQIFLCWFCTLENKWIFNFELFTLYMKLSFFNDWFEQFQKSRKGPPEVFLGKSILKISCIFTEEHPCQSVILIKFPATSMEGCFWKSNDSP